MKWSTNALPAAEAFTPAEDDAKLAAWLDARCGRLTASNMWRAMDYLKNGKPSAERTKYMIEVLTERLTNTSVRHYVTPAMQWGIDTEPEAKLAYEEMTGNKIYPAEFVEHATVGFFGATPDAFVERDGLLEAKCPTTQTFVSWRLAGGIPDEHKPQMLAQILCCTGRQWVDFFAYDPRIKDKKLNRILRRFEPTQVELDNVSEHAIRFLDELDALFDQFVNAA